MSEILFLTACFRVLVCSWCDRCGDETAWAPYKGVWEWCLEGVLGAQVPGGEAGAGFNVASMGGGGGRTADVKVASACCVPLEGWRDEHAGCGGHRRVSSPPGPGDSCGGLVWGMGSRLCP